MLVRVFVPLQVIDADPPSSFLEPEKYFTLEPGKVYELVRVPNPCYGGSGKDWFVVAGTKCGLPCEDFERRIRYGPGCVLHVEVLPNQPVAVPQTAA